MAEKLVAAVKAAAGQIKASDLNDAEATITKIEAALDRLDSSAPPQQADPAPDPQAAEWAQTQARIAPQLAALVSDGAAGADKLSAAWDMALAAAAKPDFAAALNIAAKIEPHLTPAAQPAAQPETTEDPLAALQQALAKLAARAKPIIAADAEQRGDIVMMLGLVKSALDARDAGEAREQLYNATAFLNSLEGRKAGLEALQAAVPVSLALCKINWENAADEVVDQIASVRDALSAEIDADDVAQQAAKLQKLETDVTRQGKALSEAMADVIAGQGAAAMQTAAALVAEFRAFLDSSALLKHLIQNPLEQGDDPEHMSVLVQPLDDLAANLATAQRDAA